MNEKIRNALLKLFSNRIVAGPLRKVYAVLRYSYDSMNYSDYRKRYKLHPGCGLRGTGIIIFGDGDIVIGENSYLSRYCILEACDGYNIVIGKNCSIGPYVKLYTVGNATDQDLNHDRPKEHSGGDIVVGDGCWIGANVGIRGGVEIGQNVIIGMNSVVATNIPPHCVAVGCPARVVKFKSYLSETEIARFAEDNWASLNLELQSKYQQGNLG